MGIIHKRRWFQAISALGINAYFPNWVKGEIYQGSIKGTCVPVLNCYSCPSAMGACPVGSLQNFFAGLRFNLSVAQYQFGLYIIGFLGIVGSLIGRIPCGWLCPFGLLQELMYKIKSPKWRLPRFFSYIKYVVLVVMVIALPLLVMDEFNFGETWFCKWICPAGTFEAGIPLVILNADIRNQIGFMFNWKLSILFVFLIWMIVSKRPFCRVICPLGAILGLFNKASLFRMTVDENLCVRCNSCQQDCPVDIKVYASSNSPECVRCLKCKSSCEYGAVAYEFIRMKPKEQPDAT